MGEGREAFDSLAAITVDFIDAKGHQVRRQIDTAVLERSDSWALLYFLFEERKGKADAIKWIRRVALHKYRLYGGGWRKHSAINLTPLSLAGAALRCAAVEP